MIGLICSDNICIEENTGWLVSIKANALFKIDMEEEKCEYITHFPDFKYPDFRRNPRCLKCDDVIYAFPDTGDRIWIYNLCNQETSSIEIENPSNVRLLFCAFWRVKDNIYTLSLGLARLLVINIKRQEITNFYKIPVDKEFSYMNCVKKDDKIIIIAKNSIYEFDIELKTWEINTISEIDDELSTIAYNEGLYYLTGFKKEIYIWNKKQNVLKRIQNFPKSFGEYNFSPKITKEIDYEKMRFNYPVFSKSIESKRYIWFIPFQANHILYLDKETQEINIFEIKDEDENLNTLTRGMAGKYLALYSKPNEILGLYSHKCKMLLEINMESLIWKYKNITLNIEKFGEIMADNGCIWWESELDLCDFLQVCKNSDNIEINKENVGDKIHIAI